MSRAREYAGLTWVVGLGTLVAVGITAFPERSLDLAAKEGTVEQWSHAVLLVAVVAWASRIREPPRGLAVGITLAIGVVGLEEIDWGAQWGVSGVADLLVAAVGQPNLHNLGGGASYLLFAGPWLLLYALATRWGRLRRWAARWEPHLPARTDAMAFGVLVLISGSSVLLPAHWEAALDELTELGLYGLIALGARRGSEPRTRG